jgi:hypothetical protein
VAADNASTRSSVTVMILTTGLSSSCLGLAVCPRGSVGALPPYDQGGRPAKRE